MANDKQETLEQAVKRIADEMFPDRFGRVLGKAALFRMAEWQREEDAQIAESLYDKTYWDDPVAGIAAARVVFLPDMGKTGSLVGREARWDNS